MRPPKIVMDTNVFVTALLSQRGASYKLVSLLPSGLFRIVLSVPLVFEYEAVAKRESRLSFSAIDSILDRLCALAEPHPIFFLWRPYLRDPKDDLVLELAVQARSEIIVTYNKKDFAGIEKFGLSALTPKEFLVRIGAIS